MYLRCCHAGKGLTACGAAPGALAQNVTVFLLSTSDDPRALHFNRWSGVALAGLWLLLHVIIPLMW